MNLLSKKRIYELAKEIDQPSKAVVDTAIKLGYDVKSHASTVDENAEKRIRQSFNPKTQVKQEAKPQEKQMTKENTTKSTTPPRHRNENRNGAQTQSNQNKPRTSGNSSNARPQNNENRGQQQGANRSNNAQGQSNNRPNRGNQGQGQNQSRGQKQSANRSNGGNQGQQSGYRQNSDNRNQQGGNRPNNQGQGGNRNQQQATRPNRDNNRSVQQGQGGQGTRNNDQRRSNAQGSTSANSAQNGNNERGGNRNRNNNQNRNNNGVNNNGYNKNNRKGKKGKRQQQSAPKPPMPARKFHELPEVFVYTDGMTVADVAKKIKREPAEIVKKLFMMGIMATQNHSLDKDTLELLATDYGMEAEEKVTVDIADIDKFFEPEAMNEENLVERPPVVTIMGHVDHGKTTLLDTLRNSRVTTGEAGGITQHIGAYQIEVKGKPITFLDTPGHAAFTSMRARGASITDITILVVAADDGVMPQTIEAINHAKAAGVPIIVAVNKIDKPGANPQHVMQELSEHELIPEAWGGETIFVEISAKFGQNIDELLENILLVAEVEELRADPTMRAIGTVIEARLDKGKGPVATLLVQQGTLRVHDAIVVGNTFGLVRTMVNDRGRRDKLAGPATPVEITGLNDVPQAGDHFVVFEDAKTARAAGEERAKRALTEQRKVTSRVSLDNLFDTLKDGEIKEVNVIVKADVQGTAEALSASLQKIDVEGVRVKIVHSAVGAINESDITLAEASNAIIIGFNVRLTPQARIQAENDDVDIRLHRIIYKVIEEIEEAMKGMLDPEFEEKITGEAMIRETFKVSKVGTIGGFYVTDGYIQRDSGVRVVRDSVVIFEGKLASLKRFKDDVKEVRKGFEGGLMVENFNDLQVDDVIEGYIMQEVKR